MKWFPVSRVDYAEVQTLLGRPVTSVNLQDGIYLDEDGNVFQLWDKGETKPIEVEHLTGTDETELEVLLEASLRGRKTHEQHGGSKRVQRKNRTNGRKQQALACYYAANALPVQDAECQSHIHELVRVSIAALGSQ